MSRVKFGDVVKRININVDRFNTDRLYYIGKGATIEPDALTVEPQGRINATLGFKFHFGFNPGHILFMSRCFDQHKAATATFAGICSDSTYVVETKDETVLLQRYLQLEMQSDRFWRWCEEHKSGGVNYLINYSTLETYEFNLPPISKQKVLAEKLWAAYDVKQSYIRMIAGTEEMVKSQFIEEYYVEKKYLQQLRPHVMVIRGVSYKPSDIKEKGGLNSVILLRSNNIENGRINFDDVVSVDSDRVSENQVLQHGDIVMCGSNGSKKLVGKAAMIDVMPENRCSFGAFCLGIRCKKTIHPKFLSTFFQTSIYREVIESLGAGSNILNIKPDHIYDLMVPVPPLDKQQMFASIAEQADKSEFELRKSIEAIDAVIKSLINS